ncbi:relaxase/mobilization nuclease domain-containing protein [Roseovarius sp. E0-M6]|uniref:relaxase/mobilization nuclease domain-containing protein n=1 Tax=Roseovarius sp. E0-M6 TaxID=3127118 RepID=UPI00300FA328
MILKGSARSGGSDLATHLLNAYDNERVELADIRGTIADDLHGAFAEFEAVASGTKAQKPLYSLSVNPSEPLTREQYIEAVEAIENKLGLTGQPRAVVFHIKDGREHCHVVWSRIDGAEMKAIHMAHDRRKLCDMAVHLAEQYGHELPEGLKAWKQREQFKKDRLEATLAENAQQKKSGITPEQRREDITAAYREADNASAFRHALEERGYILARGDRRAFAVVDRFGDVHSLSRYLKDVPRKEMRARMKTLDPSSLPSVEQAKEQARAQQKASAERAREQRAAQEEAVKRRSAEKRAAMERAQAARWLALSQMEQALLLTQQQERMALHAAQQTEASGVVFRMRAKVADLVAGTPALQSVLGHISSRAGLDPRARHKLENEALDRRHEREKIALEGRKKALDKIDRRERMALERDLKREALAARAAPVQRAAPQQDEKVARTDPRLLQEDGLGAAFNDRAQDARARRDDGETEGEDRRLRESWDKAQKQDKRPHRTDPRLLEEDALRAEFDEAAQARRHDSTDEGEGEDGRSQRKSWKQRAQEKGHRRGRGKGGGFGHRRGE